jgi:hypothetical protein
MEGKIEQIIIDNHGKGVNNFTRDTMINDQESAEAINVWSVGKNSLAKRPGIAKAVTIAGGLPIDGLGTYYNGGTRELLAMAGGSLYKVDPVAGSYTTVTAGWTTGLRTDFCQAGGKVFVSNGTDVLKYYDGSTVAAQSNGVVGKWMIYYKASLWIAGNTGAGNTARLYRSGTDNYVGDFTNSTANPFATSVYVSKDDGQALTGFFKHQDFLYPVKERSLWRASQGTDTAATITLQLVDPARGCDSHHSIDTVENDNFMFNEKGVFATGYEPNILDQIRTNILSLRIDSKLKSIQKSRLQYVEGMYFDNHYYLSYTAGGGTVNDTMMVYDRQRLGWWEWDLGASCFCEYKDTNGATKLYFGSSTDGAIYYFDDTAKSDSGSAILTTWRSAKLSFKDVSQSKVFLNVLLYMGKTAGTLTYTVYVDGEMTVTDTVKVGNEGTAGIGIATMGMDIMGVGGGSLELADSGGGDFIQIPINAIGRNIQIELSDNTNNQSWELNAIVVQLKKINAMYQPI